MYLYILDYNTGGVFRHKCAESDEPEETIKSLGFNLDEVYYMYSDSWEEIQDI